MKKYIAVYRGAQMCKTSIGCGLTTTELEANSIEDAKNQILENVLSEQGYADKIKIGDDKIEEKFTFIHVFEVTDSQSINLREFYAMIVKGAQEVNKRRIAQLEAEKAQFEKLKQKFEPSPPKNQNEKDETKKEEASQG